MGNEVGRRRVEREGFLRNNGVLGMGEEVGSIEEWNLSFLIIIYVFLVFREDGYRVENEYSDFEVISFVFLVGLYRSVLFGSYF